MKRKLIILLILAIISLKAYSQDSINAEVMGNNMSYTEIFDSIFRNIRYDTLSTKILYSRVIPFAKLEEKNGLTNDTINENVFIQAYSELHRASDTDLKVFSMDVESLRDNIFFNSNDSLIQIGIIYSDFSVFDTNAFNDNRFVLRDSIIYINDTNTRNIFINKKTFVSSALSTNIYNHLSISFNISNQFLFKNASESINKILINYNNGEGDYSYSVSDNLSIFENINYQTFGDKYITIKLVTSNGDTLNSISKINLKEDIKSLLNFDRFETFAYQEHLGVKGKGDVRIYYSDSTMILKKPILIVDGFDPGSLRLFDKDLGDKDEGGIWGLCKIQR